MKTTNISFKHQFVNSLSSGYISISYLVEMISFIKYLCVFIQKTKKIAAVTSKLMEVFLFECKLNYSDV